MRWPSFTHTYGTPESTSHKLARVGFYRVGHIFRWKLPKWLGLDRCSVCGDGPCGTKIGPDWRCSIHSTFVKRGHGAAEPGAALRVIPGGRA